MTIAELRQRIFSPLFLKNVDNNWREMPKNMYEGQEKKETFKMVLSYDWKKFGTMGMKYGTE